MRRKIATNIRNIEESAIKNMRAEISLAQGIPIIEQDLSDEFLSIMKKKESFFYTQQSGLPSLRECIAERIGKDKKNIIITSGAISGLMCVFLSILEKGDEVILLAPTYPSYIEQISLIGARPVLVDLDEKGFRLDKKKLEQSMTENTKCIVICTPSNPTGTMLEKDEIEFIADLCRNKNILIISDETYSDLVYEGYANTDILYKLCKENYICISSFSKSLALSGLRVGYVYANDILIKEISKANDAISICAPSLSQYLLVELFKSKKIDIMIRKVREELKERRDLTCSLLDDLGLRYAKPEGALYVFVKVDDDIRFSNDLLKEGVAVVPGSSFGKKGYVRISFGQEKEKIKMGFEKIKKYLAKAISQNKKLISQ